MSLEKTINFEHSYGKPSVIPTHYQCEMHKDESNLQCLENAVGTVLDNGDVRVCRADGT